RQSVEKKDSISIETQIDFCRRELLGARDVVIYSDKGYSGSNIQRPDFQRLLDEVKCGGIKRIVVYRIDRVSRSVLDFSNLMELFAKYGVTFISTQEKFDTGTPMGKAMLSIAMVFAQLERETIQQRITDNYYARGAKGMYLGGPASFGFERTSATTEHGRLKMLKENPETVDTMARLFDMYGVGLLSLGAIAKTLNAEGIPSPGGGLWDSGKVSRILRNPVCVKSDADIYRYYKDRGCIITNDTAEFALGKGCYLYGKREAHERKYTDVTNHKLSLAPHDGIISSELFLICQRRLDANKQIDNRRRSEITWLTGLIKCGKCEHSVIPKTSNMGKYTYLYCTGKANYACCDIEGNLGALKTVEDAVEDRIFSWADRYSGLKASSESADGRKRENLRCRIEEIELAAQRLVDLAIQSSDITAGYLNDKLAVLETERKTLEEELYRQRDNPGAIPAKSVSDIRADWSGLDIRKKNGIASLLISRILLFKGECEIEWNFDFDIE
ncbi:MAG: recombinase family protein, partial [Oscillospiraceae bacterium]|nr:recombinase family protein [Oscillospiraceae bacterium]